MSSEIRVLLIDVDGVLVEPQAYRIGITRTLEFLCKRCGIANWEQVCPSEAEIAFMESLGIHDVWDITNIVFAQLLAARGTNSGEPKQVQRPDYTAFSKRINAGDAQGHPPDIARLLLTDELKSQPELLAEIDIFLQGTRDPYRSYGTRIFQNIILGADTFRNTYQLPCEYAGESLLECADIALLSRDSLDKIIDLKERQDWSIAIYTARPSRAPVDLGEMAGYSPEAECALRLCNVADGQFPLVGMGMMDWLAAQYNARSEDLTKPNATQAFAALTAALSQRIDADLLKQAYAWSKMGKIPSESPLNEFRDKRCSVYVIEDTISGINPILTLCRALNSEGFNINATPIGIAHDSAKKQALAKVCGSNVVADVNEALKLIASFQSVSGRS